MSYEFKKLSDVDIVDTPIETANILIEEEGSIKKVPASNMKSTESSPFDVVFYAKDDIENVVVRTGDLLSIIQKIRNYQPIKSCLLMQYTSGSPSTYYMYQDAIISTPFFVFEEDGDDKYLTFDFDNTLSNCIYNICWGTDGIRHAYSSMLS